MYINLNYKWINTDHVATVKIDHDKNRIYFSMDYAIVKDGIFTQDFIFIEKNEENLELLYEIMNNINFIQYNKDRYVNRNAISSFKYDHKNNRIIVNLCSPHTYNINNETKVLPEFVYIDNIYSVEQFNDFLYQLNS
jgi:hypothetical protein